MLHMHKFRVKDCFMRFAPKRIPTILLFRNCVYSMNFEFFGLSSIQAQLIKYLKWL